MTTSKLQQHKTAHVKYTKATNLGEGSVGEITERHIVPTFIPPTNIKAIDVTDMSDEQRAIVEQRLAEYAEYYQTFMKTLFSFDTWLEQTHQEYADVKWRTFKQDNLVVLDD